MFSGGLPAMSMQEQMRVMAELAQERLAAEAALKDVVMDPDLVSFVLFSLVRNGLFEFCFPHHSNYYYCVSFPKT
jgi:hypothetical protein